MPANRLVGSSSPVYITETVEVTGSIAIGGDSGVSISDGLDATQGAIADAAVTTNATGTVSAKLRGIVANLATLLGRWPASLGSLTKAGSVSVTLASDEGDLPVAVTDPWDTVVTADVTADDSDKTIAVTASKVWQLLSIQVSLATTAAVGDRQMTVDVTDASDNLLARMRAGVTQAASLTYTYTFGVGLSDQPAVLSLHLTTPLLPLILPAGYKIRVYDSAAIAAAADDMTVRVTVMERAA